MLVSRREERRAAAAINMIQAAPIRGCATKQHVHHSVRYGMRTLCLVPSTAGRDALVLPCREIKGQSSIYSSRSIRNLVAAAAENNSTATTRRTPASQDRRSTLTTVLLKCICSLVCSSSDVRVYTPHTLKDAGAWVKLNTQNQTIAASVQTLVD